MRTINETLLSTLAACGDVERNVLCCPAPIRDHVRDAMQDDADLFASHCAPRSSTYWEIWLDGEKVENQLPPPGRAEVPTPGDDPVEPIYGKTYLPRKFKTAFALPEDNCTDIHANDLGYLAVVEGGRLTRLQRARRRRAWARPRAPRRPSRYLARAALLRRPGRKSARSARPCSRSTATSATAPTASAPGSSTSSTTGAVPAFRAKVEEYLGHPLDDPQKPVAVTEVDDHLGWHEQATASSSWASPSRTAGSRTTARSASSVPQRATSRRTRPPRG